MGLPIVATRIPGVIDAVVDGAGGTLVDVDDAPALGEAVLSYLLDPKLARAHGQAARRQVRAKFRPEPIFEETADVYRRHWGAEPEGGKPAALT
jgi:glycosyltransferase involved in cell wall biosynthesis